MPMNWSINLKFIINFSILCCILTTINFYPKTAEVVLKNPIFHKNSKDISTKKPFIRKKNILALTTISGFAGLLFLAWLAKNSPSISPDSDKKEKSPETTLPVKNEFDLPDDENFESELKIEGKCTPESFGKARFRKDRTAAGWETDDSTQGFSKGICLLKTMLDGKPAKEVDPLDILGELSLWRSDEAPVYYQTKAANDQMYSCFGLGAAIKKAIDHYNNNKNKMSKEELRKYMESVVQKSQPTNGTCMNGSIITIATHSNHNDRIQGEKNITHATHNNPQVDCCQTILNSIAWEGINQAGKGIPLNQKIKSVVFDTLKKYKANLENYDFYKNASELDKKAINWTLDKNLAFENMSLAELKSLRNKMEDPEILKEFYPNVTTELLKNDYFKEEPPIQCTVRHLPNSSFSGGFEHQAVYHIDSTGYVGGSFTSAIASLVRGSFEDTPGKICQEAMNYCQSLRGDTDTTMAILGQILGSMSGASGMPKYWRKSLARANFGLGLAEALYLGGNGVLGDQLAQELGFENNEIDDSKLCKRGDELLKLIEERKIDPKKDACLGVMLGMMAGDSMGAGPEVLPGTKLTKQLRSPKVEES